MAFRPVELDSWARECRVSAMRDAVARINAPLLTARAKQSGDMQFAENPTRSYVSSQHK
jgi:hypothetical protein